MSISCAPAPESKLTEEQCRHLIKDLVLAGEMADFDSSQLIWEFHGEKHEIDPACEAMIYEYQETYF